ncbi:MAG TPA: hypothetical protein VGO88_04745 [Mycetocola sp.]|nr:hypothetical protein [Mycetocola sp.]
MPPKHDSAAALPVALARSTQSPATTSATRVPAAEQRLAMFLDRSRLTNELSSDSLWSCWPDGMTETYLALADARVLGSAQHGDTVTAEAEVVSVAYEVPAPKGRYITTVHTRVDTMHWKMTRDSSNGLWGVCDYSLEGWGFGHYGNDAHTTWEPAGYTWARVERMADSIKRGR